MVSKLKVEELKFCFVKFPSFTTLRHVFEFLLGHFMISPPQISVSISRKMENPAGLYLSPDVEVYSTCSLHLLHQGPHSFYRSPILRSTPEMT